MEGRNVANKARQMYNRHNGSPLASVAATQHNRVIASAAQNGSIALCNIEKQSLVASRQINVEEDGSPLDLLFCDLGSSPILFYSTTFGTVVGWDLRKPGDAVRFESELRNGLLTAMAISGDESWLAAGTSNGVLSCWDFRFKLQVSTCQHPNKSLVQGNNEVGVWNLESGSRQQVLWASPSPPLSTAAASQQSVCAMLWSGNCVVTGGTDAKLRWWDLAQPNNSQAIASDVQPTYRTKLVDGTEVLQEVPMMELSKFGSDNHMEFSKFGSDNDMELSKCGSDPKSVWKAAIDQIGINSLPDMLCKDKHPSSRLQFLC